MARGINEFASAENGLVAFASSTGREDSVGNDAWQNGAFTKALVEGLRAGWADRLHAGTITLTQLDAFVVSRVKELTSGLQHPVMTRPPRGPGWEQFNKIMAAQFVTQMDGEQHARIRRLLTPAFSSRRIGIDFDNTLVSYDRAFALVGMEEGLLPADFVGGKEAVKQQLCRERPDGYSWERLQGLVYGRSSGGRQAGEQNRRWGIKISLSGESARSSGPRCQPSSPSARRTSRIDRAGSHRRARSWPVCALAPFQQSQQIKRRTRRVNRGELHAGGMPVNGTASRQEAR
jgi:hypothetical protein